MTRLTPLAIALVLSCSVQQAPPPAPVADVATPAVLPRSRLHRKVKKSAAVKALAAAPPLVDARTPLQLAQAACAGRCPAVHGALMASPTSPVVPASWTIPAWYVDNANSSGCASDSSSGTSATCTGGCVLGACPSGIGPLLTYQELLVHRWGCQGNPAACPRILQATTITFLSSDAASDPVYLFPAIENGQYLQVGGTPTQVCSGAITVNAAKNRTTGTRLTATVCSGATVGELAVNATHPSAAWTDTLVAGSEFTFSQPLQRVTSPWSGVDPNEVDTWATSDVVAIYTLPTAYVFTAQPQIGQASDTLGTLYLYDLVVAGANPNIRQVPNEVHFTSAFTSFGTSDAVINCVVDGSAFAPDPIGQSSQANFKGGILRQPDLLTYAPMGIEGGTLVEGLGIESQNSGINDVYVASGAILSTGGSVVVSTYGSTGPASTTPFVWGPGTFNVDPPSVALIDANTSSPTLLVTSTTLDSLANACSLTNASPGVWHCGIAVSGTNIDAPAGAAGFGGAALDPVGAYIITLSSPF